MAEINKDNVFEYLNSINVGDKIEKKMGLSYLSWANAWALLKTNYPDAEWKIYTRTIKTTTTETTTDAQFGSTKTVVTESELEIPYFTDGKTTYVKVSVTINGVEYMELYPIMDLKNNAVSVSAVNMVQVNKALQRAFVKACARHGLGLYIYAGEDIPQSEKKAPINYNDIETSVNNVKFNELGDGEVAKVAAQVGEKYGKLAETSAGNYINEYMQRLLKDYQISKVSENSIALQKLLAVLNAIESALE